MAGAMKDHDTRRAFLQRSGVLAASAVTGGALPAQDASPDKPVSVSSHPVLTPAEEFQTVARGNPKPHSLTGEALVNARLTPETWRASQPCWDIRLGSRTLVLSQPTSSVLVYLLGFLTLAMGLRSVLEAPGDASRQSELSGHRCAHSWS